MLTLLHQLQELSQVAGLHKVKKYNFENRKSIHIHLMSGTHAEFRTELFRRNLTMQEVLEECAERVAGGDKYMEKLLDDCVTKKITGERRVAIADAEDLYKIIESSTTHPEIDTDE